MLRSDTQKSAKKAKFTV